MENTTFEKWRKEVLDRPKLNETDCLTPFSLQYGGSSPEFFRPYERRESWDEDGAFVRTPPDDLVLSDANFLSQQDSGRIWLAIGVCVLTRVRSTRCWS